MHRYRFSITIRHAHKSTVTDIRWNQNGNWLLTSSRDHLIKIYDIRNMLNEMQTFRGHKKEVNRLAWHPIHETLFTSGGSEGSILFWLVGSVASIISNALISLRNFIFSVLRKRSAASNKPMIL